MKILKVLQMNILIQHMKKYLHDIFKNINGYIETDFTGSPEHEYESDNPIYEKHSQQR